jgi:hypothetical protein
MISQFHNLTSLVLTNPQPAALLASLSHWNMLKNITLIGSKFSDLWRYWAISWYAYTSLIYGSQTCISSSKTVALLNFFIFTFHFFVTCYWVETLSPGNRVQCQFWVFPTWLLLKYIWPHFLQCSTFQTVSKIRRNFHISLLNLAILIHRKILTCLEQLYLGCYIVIHVRGITATKTEFPWVDMWLCEIYGRERVCEIFLLLFVYQLFTQYIFRTLSNLIVYTQYFMDNS